MARCWRSGHGSRQLLQRERASGRAVTASRETWGVLLRGTGPLGEPAARGCPAGSDTAGAARLTEQARGSAEGRTVAGTGGKRPSGGEREEEEQRQAAVRAIGLTGGEPRTRARRRGTVTCAREPAAAPHTPSASLPGLGHRHLEPIFRAGGRTAHALPPHGLPRMRRGGCGVCGGAVLWRRFSPRAGEPGRGTGGFGVWLAQDQTVRKPKNLQEVSRASQP